MQTARSRSFEVGQKTLIGALDKLSQDEDYADLHAWDLKFSRKGTKMATEYSVLPSPRKVRLSKRTIDQGSLERCPRSRVTICSNSWWVATPSAVDLEDQLDLVDQVMMDRSLPSRAGPRRQRLKELGLPDDANVGTLMTLWRYRRTNRRYVKGQPKFG